MPHAPGPRCWTRARQIGADAPIGRADTAVPPERRQQRPAGPPPLGFVGTPARSARGHCGSRQAASWWATRTRRIGRRGRPLVGSPHVTWDDGRMALGEHGDPWFEQVTRAREISPSVFRGCGWRRGRSSSVGSTATLRRPAPRRWSWPAGWVTTRRSSRARGFAVEAFDLSPSAIAAARRRFRASAGVRYRVADLFALPAGSAGRFAIVVEVLTVQSLAPEAHQQAIAAITRCVAPGGALLVRTAVRADEEPADTRPWPLCHAELRWFTADGLHEVSRLVRRPRVPAPSLPATGRRRRLWPDVSPAIWC